MSVTTAAFGAHTNAAAGFRLVFRLWEPNRPLNCVRPPTKPVRLQPSELDPYQRVVYAHNLMLKGNYGEALDLCETQVYPKPARPGWVK